ncbi:POK9 protein, partial [Dryoscopus gambensis]|nr:POK9 protein [Dryoscopus gambensis]
GSLGLDLATAVDVTLIDTKPVPIPTTTHGPIDLKQTLGALLIGRSSTGLKGIHVIPGLTDADYTGTIKVVVYTLHQPAVIPQGTRLAQLIPLQNLAAKLTMRVDKLPHRGDHGFGSTGGLVCFTMPMMKQPEITCTLQRGREYTCIQALLDTGADVTIVS